MPTSPTPRRISWDLLRVVAVLAVILGHVTHQGALLHPELTGYPFRVTAQFGAAILLVISAFFVCASLRKGDPRRWLWNRVARLVPAYLVAVIVTYLVTRWAAISFSGLPYPPGVTGFLFGVPQGPPTNPSPWYIPTWLDLVTNLGMVQEWGIRWDAFYYLDGSYWTLPVQLMAFTGAALLWPRPWRTHRLTVALLWALILVPLTLRFVVFPPGTASPLVETFYYGLGLHRLHVFAIGVAIWLWSQRRLKSWHVALFVFAAVAAQDLQVFPFHVALPQDALRWPSTIGFAVLLLLVCLAARGPDWRFPGLARIAPAVTWLAGISYGLYLVHQELGYILARALLDLGLPGWLRLPAVVGAAVLAGWAVTAGVERPAHRWLTRRRKPAKPQVEDAEPVFVGGGS
ncbi:acyltransferase family protein [Amycolatopsis eburnea]|uniref:Acyltransferase n=1 Tax=Amycolatopsis eburnea TaxID=2267691 RepID=A0A427T6D3_9PSEU|nr:acyltransferase [Amycolatopsis eburnea]RSD14870.1 acyltransferase [Amycolatopsis eburnea]